jgi:hypothetical protein
LERLRGVAEKAAYELNINSIEKETTYDGFMPYVQILTMTCRNSQDNP